MRKFLCCLVAFVCLAPVLRAAAAPPKDDPHLGDRFGPGCTEPSSGLVFPDRVGLLFRIPPKLPHLPAGVTEFCYAAGRTPRAERDLQFLADVLIFPGITPAQALASQKVAAARARNVRYEPYQGRTEFGGEPALSFQYTFDRPEWGHHLTRMHVTLRRRNATVSFDFLTIADGTKLWQPQVDHFLAAILSGN